MASVHHASGMGRALPDGPTVRALGGVEAIRESLVLIVYRALRTGLGPAPIVRWVREQAVGAVERSAKRWRLARVIAAEMAPILIHRLTAKAESVRDNDTRVNGPVIRRG
jgi:hypothetical protein